MPTYEYRCNGCDHEWEDFQSIKAPPTKKCPGCGKSRAERIISAGGGIIFKGSGFYQTDYRSESYKKGASADKKAKENASKENASKDSSSSGKSDAASKPAKSSD